MNEISETEIQVLANKLMFNINENEMDRVKNDFDTMCQQINEIEKIKDLHLLDPLVYPYINDEASFRVDEVTKNIDVSDAFSNAKEVEDNEIRVPKVVG